MTNDRVSMKSQHKVRKFKVKRGRKHHPKESVQQEPKKWGRHNSSSK